MTKSRGQIHTPRYMMRRNIILSLLDRYKPGRFLEIGCGRGELMPWLANRGFEGVGLEISDEARALTEQTISHLKPRLRVVGDPAALAHERFQYVMAFEVLEHIEDDVAALRSWSRWLEPDGRLLISVPARMKNWTIADEVGGHFRRYEREQLESLLESCGYQIETFWSYGFPVTAVTGRLRPILYRSRLKQLRSIGPQERTLRSALDSTLTVGRSARWVCQILEVGGRGFHLLQLPFRRFDLGDGYLAACRRA